MNNLLTKRKRNLLVTGYIHAGYKRFIPQELVELCYVYYNDIIDWIFTGDEFDELLDTKCCVGIYGEKLILNDIVFQLVIFPNGATYQSQGYVLLGLQLEKIPDDIDNFAIYIHLFCEQMNVSWKQPVTGNMLLSLLDKTIEWFRYNMSLKDTKDRDFKSLEFGIYVEVLDITYNKQLKDKIFITNTVSMKVKYEYQWIVDGDILEIFRLTKPGKCLYSSNFNNDCWSMVIIPNGRKDDKQKIMRISVKLLRLPIGIKSIEVMVKLQIIANNEEYNKSYEFKEDLMYDRKAKTSTLDQVINTDIFNEKLIFIASVEIIKGWDQQNLEIDKSMWFKYHFIE